MHKTLIRLAVLTVLAAASAQAAGFINNGLVGVGRLPSNLFDQLGGGTQDTLGGMFSSMSFDLSTWQRTGTEGNYTYSGTLFALPDRGFGDGAQDYHNRVETFSLSITPNYSGIPTSAQNQISLQNTASTLLRDNTGALFTGFNPNDNSNTTFPQTTAGSLGGGKRSMDSEGLARLKDNTFYVSDEYGPNILKFDAAGNMIGSLTVPNALIPKLANGTTKFDSSTADPASGRRGNRGLEGLTVTPDEKYLFAMAQSPAMQDNGNGSAGRNTRILKYDIDPKSPTYNQMVGEYVYQLEIAGGKHTPISEIIALNDNQLMVIERDKMGRNGDPGAPVYKKVNIADLTAATNIAGTVFDKAKNESGWQTLGSGGNLPVGVTPVAKTQFVDLIDSAQLSKFNLNAKAAWDDNTISEKWEGLALIPLNDPAKPNDYLLLVGNDNDFSTQDVYHNGVVVGHAGITVDSMMLAYSVTLPGAEIESVPEASTFAGAGIVAALSAIRFARRRK